ncbi:sulfite exporter TauE/SafE family protein [Candidatus Woesearchaeota archaeon]|nr:sulfite exporter TauE/SafE family protein [Candidatus Woesearchaeota archaeon]
MTFPFLSLGLLLGLQHALEADHITAVSVQVARTQKIRHALSHGLLWGAGHAGALLLLGGAFLFFQKEIPKTVAIFFEVLVGILLIVLGILAWRNKINKNKKNQTKKNQNGKKSFAIGSMHGLAGSSAVVMLLAATATTVWKGFFFLLLFGMGGVLSMMLFSILLSLSLQFLKQKKMQVLIPHLAAISSIVMGVVVLVRVGGGMIWG